MISFLFTSIRNNILLLGILGLIALAAVVASLEARLPSVDVLRDVQLQVPLKIYSADGKLIAEYGEKRRNPITLPEVPQKFIYAILATEDRRFYQHPGVDMRGILRATVSLVTKGTKEQGGSTITMQVARNFFLSRKKTFIRKINEILLAIKIEQELSKDEILELYLNKIYLGKRAYGIAAAADVYYGTTIDKLTLAQMATIAGLPQAPSAINPISDPAASLKRRAHVLSRMLTYEFITQKEYDAAMAEPVTAKYHARAIELEAPYVAEMVRLQMVDKIGDSAYDNGYKVITTVHSKHQHAANAAFRRALYEYDQRHGFRKPKQTLATTPGETESKKLQRWHEELQLLPRVNTLIPAAITAIEHDKIHIILQDNKKAEISWNNMKWIRPGSSEHAISNIFQLGNVVYVTKTKINGATTDAWRLAQIPEVSGALVALSPADGALLALIGGLDYEQSLFNRAAQAERQPGSSLKPFIYTAALDSGFTAASIINDAPIVQADPSQKNDWRPQNHTKRFYGPTRLRTGIVKSRNLVSIRLLNAVGIPNTINFLEHIGFERNSLPNGLSLALGTNSITPLKLAANYCVFPNGGSKIEPYFIKAVFDYQDNLIFEYKPTPPTPVLNPKIAYLMTSILQDAVRTGTGRKAMELGRQDLAGKTGSTNDHYDAWFAGYNKDIVAITWLGFDEPRNLKEYGSTAALPMWMYFIDQALKDSPNNPPLQPPGLITVRIDPQSGLLARAGQTDGIYELFVDGTAPTQVATSKSNEAVDNNTQTNGDEESEESLF